MRPSYSRFLLALRLEELLRPAAKTAQVEAGKQYHVGSPKLPPTLAEPLLQTAPTDREVREQVARVAHVSHGTVDKVKVIEQKATPEQKAELVSGSRTINSL